MGMFDDIQCDLVLPGEKVPPVRLMQTKSLGCGMGRYTITAQGRLIFHKIRYEFGENKEIRPGLSLPQGRSVPLGDVDVEFHGDIRLWGQSIDGKGAEYVARFTHGSLEWIRPFDEEAEHEKPWL